MHQAQFSFVPLLIVIALAFAVPVALSPIKRYGIPVVVGEILAGILFGHSGLGLIQTDPVLQVLSVFGFAYLMFLSGLEINFAEAASGRRGLAHRRLVRNPFFVGTSMFVISAGLSYLAGLELTRHGLARDPWIMAMILTTSSLGVVAPVLKERGLTTVKFGQSILIGALLADFITILLVSAYVIYLHHGANPRVLLVLVLLAVFMAAYRMGTRFQRYPPVRRIMRALSTATAQIRVRAALFITLIFMALSESLGIANVLGAFLAGVTISLLSGRGVSLLREKLDAIGYGFLIPIFFIMVGARFDLSALSDAPRSLILVPVLIGLAYGVKFASVLVMRLGYSWRETFAAGALLNARLSFIVAVATIGVELGVIPPAVNSAIILVAVVTSTLSPILFSQILPRKHRVGSRVFVIGSRPEAETLAQRLQEQHDLDVLLVRDPGTSGTPSSSEQSRAGLLERLREAGMGDAGTVVAMAEESPVNFDIVRLARNVFATRDIIAWVGNPADSQRYREAGVRIVTPQYSTLLMLEGMVTNPSALSVGADPGENQEVQVVKLRNPLLAGRAIRETGLWPEVQVIRIDRGDATLVPETATVVQVNDALTLSGAKADVDAAARLLARR